MILDFIIFVIETTGYLYYCSGDVKNKIIAQALRFKYIGGKPTAFS
jgi:hypothetical protein